MKVSPIWHGLLAAVILAVATILLVPAHAYSKDSVASRARMAVKKMEVVQLSGTAFRKDNAKILDTISRSNPRLAPAIESLRDREAALEISAWEADRAVQSLREILDSEQPGPASWSMPGAPAGIAFTVASILAFILEIALIAKKRLPLSNRVWKLVGSYAPIAWFGGMLTLIAFYGTVAGTDYHMWFRFLLAVWLVVLTHFFWQAESVYRKAHEPAAAA